MSRTSSSSTSSATIGTRSWGASCTTSPRSPARLRIRAWRWRRSPREGTSGWSRPRRTTRSARTRRPSSSRSPRPCSGRRTSGTRDRPTRRKARSSTPSSFPPCSPTRRRGASAPSRRWTKHTSRPRRSSSSGAPGDSWPEDPATAAEARPLERSAQPWGVPWYVSAVIVAATSAVVGVIWDISWHRTIGRDTFWTPAHLAIYLGGALAGAACGWLVLKTTFAGTPEQRAAGVSFWGFRGPLGAWVCIWGAIAMITSAPLDNWWHNAYGLDVKVLSPPHVILAAGTWGIKLGALLLVLALQNREVGAARRVYGLLLAYGFGILVLNKAIMGFEQIGFPHDAHNGL